MRANAAGRDPGSSVLGAGCDRWVTRPAFGQPEKPDYAVLEVLRDVPGDEGWRGALRLIG